MFSQKSYCNYKKYLWSQSFKKNSFLKESWPNCDPYVNHLLGYNKRFHSESSRIFYEEREGTYSTRSLIILFLDFCKRKTFLGKESLETISRISWDSSWQLLKEFLESLEIFPVRISWDNSWNLLRQFLATLERIPGISWDNSWNLLRQFLANLERIPGISRQYLVALKAVPVRISWENT